MGTMEWSLDLCIPNSHLLSENHSVPQPQLPAQPCEVQEEAQPLSQGLTMRPKAVGRW